MYPYTPYSPNVPRDTHKPIRIYMGGLILVVNTLYRVFCFFQLFITEISHAMCVCVYVCAYSQAHVQAPH